MTADYIIHHWYVDFTSGTLLHQERGEQRRLGEYQLKLLLVLAEHAGKILTREELTNLVWERRVIGSNSLPNAIHALRVALEDDGKQQRIIKTIPKKGYILEAEYCQRVSLAELDALSEITLQPDSDAPEVITLQQDDAAAEVSPHEAEPVATLSPSAPRRIGFWLIPAQVILLLGLVWWVFIMPMMIQATKVIELDSATYSNIRLLELDRLQGRVMASEDLNKQLGPALYPLNQILKNQQVKMDVIFFASSTSLNYTLTLKNKCSREQLAMNILNSRMNGALLRALIYRETERKLNEMENCVN